VQPLATIKRHLVVIPQGAEKEIGFTLWLIKVWNIARNTGAKIVFIAPESILKIVQDIHNKHVINAEFREFTDFDDFLILSRDIKIDDNLIIIMSRRNHTSYVANMAKIQHYLNKYFKEINCILVYPIQSGFDGRATNNYNDSSLMETITQNMEKIDNFGKNIRKLFKSK
jgi:hypothetical protein